MKIARLVTCPESAHLEEIEYIEHPLGMLVTRCSAWSQCTTCPRTCAARLDLKHRLARRLDPGALLLARSCLRD